MNNNNKSICLLPPAHFGFIRATGWFLDHADWWRFNEFVWTGMQFNLQKNDGGSGVQKSLLSVLLRGTLFSWRFKWPAWFSVLNGIKGGDVKQDSSLHAEILKHQTKVSNRIRLARLHVLVVLVIWDPCAFFPPLRINNEYSYDNGGLWHVFIMFIDIFNTLIG